VIILQFQYTPQHLVRLLQIIVDNNCNMAVRQVASIHFKNFIAKNWAPHEPGMLSSISYANCLKILFVFDYLMIAISLVLLFVVGELPKISASDKAMVRDHILVFLVRVPPLLRYSCLISTVSPIILVFTCWDFALS